jgi:hypothetical protein
LRQLSPHHLSALSTFPSFFGRHRNNIMSSTTAHTFAFPHATLTPLHGKPTSATIKLLQREVFANARAIHSTRGGGANGYLAICMTDAIYLARAGQAFIIPVHPGPQPVHAAAATVAQITATNREWDQELLDFNIYHAVTETIRKQILEAVNPTFYDVLEDDTFGYADVTILNLLTHIQDEYGTMTRTDLESNRNLLKAAWNPDDEFANLWTKIKTVRQIAVDGGDPISDNTTMELTVQSLRQAGVYGHALQTWDDKSETEQTYANFKTHFSLQEKNRLRNLTAKAAGFNATACVPPAVHVIPPTDATAAAANTSGTNTKTNFVSNEIQLFYCWTHGLSRNPAHTGSKCENKATGHKDCATVDNRMGGVNRINFGKSGRQRE